MITLVFKESYTREELLDGIREAIEKERKEKEEQRKYFERKEKEEQFRKRTNNYFYNVSLDKTSYLVNEVKLTNKELGYLYFLGAYTDYTKNNSKYSKLTKSLTNKEGLTNKEIRKILNIKRDETFYNFINKLLNYGILIVDDKKCYWINNIYIFKGERELIGGNIMSIETKEMKKGIKQMKAEHFGILIKMLPYVSCKVPALVRNPNETDTDKIEYMQTVKEICETVGIDVKSFNKLWNLRIDDRCLLFQLRNNKGKRYGINFKILHRGTIDQIKENCNNAKLNIDEML